MKKGQILSLDALLALVAVAVIIGYSSWAFENAMSQGRANQYDKLSMVANDWAHIAVKRELTIGRPNVVDETNLFMKWTSFESLMDDSIDSSYSYEASLAGLSFTRGTCIGKANVAVAKRMIYVYRTSFMATEPYEFELKVCI